MYWIGRGREIRPHLYQQEPSAWPEFVGLRGVIEGTWSWEYAEWFEHVDDAVDCVYALIRVRKARSAKLWVMDDEGTVVWHETSGYTETVETCLSTYPQEEQTLDTSDIQQPLTIERQKLIDTLQSNLDTVTKERNDADASRAANRATLAAEIHKFSDDELVEFFTRKLDFCSTLDATQWFEKAREHKSYVPASVAVTPRETSLEKYVRVLSLASNDTIEVTPNDPVYPLL